MGKAKAKTGIGKSDLPGLQGGPRKRDFVLYGTVRASRLYPDHVRFCERPEAKFLGPTLPLFWTAADLAEKLRVFQRYFNRHRAHSGLEGGLPEPGEAQETLSFTSYRWQQHCRGLYQTPIAE